MGGLILAICLCACALHVGRTHIPCYGTHIICYGKMLEAYASPHLRWKGYNAAHELTRCFRPFLCLERLCHVMRGMDCISSEIERIALCKVHLQLHADEK